MRPGFGLRRWPTWMVVGGAGYSFLEGKEGRVEYVRKTRLNDPRFRGKIAGRDGVSWVLVSL